MSLSVSNAITSALLSAVQTALSSSIPTVAGSVPANIATIYTGLTVNGEPPPMAAEWFAGVHKDPVSQNTPAAGGRHTYVDETFSAQITISQRVSRYAEDRIAGSAYPTLQDKIRVVTSYLANNPYTIMAAINAELVLTSTNGCIEPFFVTNPSPPIQKRGKNWYKATSRTATQATLAVSATIRLDGLRRVQATGGIN